MITTLTREQMLERWRVLRAIEPPRLDCTVSRTDGPDIDAILENEMRTRYLQMLDSAHPRMLAPHDMASEAQVSVLADSRTALITPPLGTRRILSLSFDHGAPLIPDAPQVRVESAAKNPMWHRPLAALLPDGRVMVAVPGVQLTELTVIFDHGPELYEFDDSLWKELIY